MNQKKQDERLKKLALNRETIRKLDDAQLRQVAGGDGPPETSRRPTCRPPEE
jgi:hypothetical protein